MDSIELKRFRGDVDHFAHDLLDGLAAFDFDCFFWLAVGVVQDEGRDCWRENAGKELLTRGVDEGIKLWRAWFAENSCGECLLRDRRIVRAALRTTRPGFAPALSTPRLFFRSY